MEKQGTPVVPVLSPYLVESVRDAAFELGWLHPRFVSLSEPDALRSDKAIQRIINGKDPVSGKPLMRAIVDALTKPLTADEKKTGKLNHPVEPRILPVTGTYDELQKYFLKNRMTDGLPVVIPTEEKVKEMLTGTSHRPDEVVAEAFRMGITENGQREGRNITVEKVAVISIMAGCKPEYLPVLLALASKGPPYFSSAQSFTGAAIVHGPIAGEIGMESGYGCMGPYNHANATIGRAWQLMGRCLCYAVPGLTIMGDWGNNLQYNSLTFAENADNPMIPWEPFHVEQGYKPEDSVVSVWEGRGLRQRCGHNVPNFALKVLDNVEPENGALVLLTPLAAKMLEEDFGFDTRAKFRQYLYENSTMTVQEWLDSDMVQTFAIPHLELPAPNEKRRQAQEDIRKRLKMPGDTVVKRFRSPSQINMVITGEGMIYFVAGADFNLKGIVAIDTWR
ncbi:MAG: hypothetical protein JXA51_06260 [Dehalococcoidales bacterium]|nr:hypothetical protein [Dehalococcoidales bacterium]